MVNLKNTLLKMDFSGNTKVDFSELIKNISLHNNDCIESGIFYAASPAMSTIENLNVQNFEAALTKQFENLPICYMAKNKDFPIMIKTNWAINIWKLNKKYHLHLPNKFNGLYIVIGQLNYNHIEIVKLLNHTKNLPS